MKNLIRLLVCAGVLTIPQFLSADDNCNHAFADCSNPDVSASDVMTCWRGDGTYTQTTYWCNGDITTIVGGGRGGVKHKTM